VAEGQGNTIVTYGVSLPGLPVMECVISGANGGEFGRPVWSPDGSSLAWEEGDGIWSIALGRDCSGTQRLVIPGGSEPDWGPADPDGGSPGPAGPAVVIPRSIAGGARLNITVTCAGSCRATATARVARRVVAKASKRVSGGGKLSLRPRRLRGARRLAVKVTVTPDGGAATTIARNVKVKPRH
jgi:hypothetical protein